MLGNVFSITAAIGTVTAAKTLVQIRAGLVVPLELLRVMVSFSGFGEISDTAEIVIARKTAPATVTVFTPVKLVQSSQDSSVVVSTTGTGTSASAEGTDGDVLVREAVNTLTGFEWLAGTLPGGKSHERLIIPAGGIVGIKSNILITSATVHVMAEFKELA